MTDVNGTEPNDLCREVEERIADVLSANADEALLDHAAECDRCRDLRFEVEQARELVVIAGVDYTHRPDFTARLLARLDALAGEPTASDELEDEQEANGAAALDEAPEEPATEDANEKEQSLTREEGAPRDQQRESGEDEQTEGTVPPNGDAMGHEAAHASATASKGEVRSNVFELRQPRKWLALLVAAAVLFLWWRADRRLPSGEQQAAAVGAEWAGQVQQVRRAFGSTTGLSVCDASGEACRSLETTGEVPAGSWLKTDGLTRAWLRMSDESELFLDRSTELRLSEKVPRSADLLQGDVVVVADRSSSDVLVLGLPQGRLEVVGTKFALHADEEESRVEVSRGEVRLLDRADRMVSVLAGQTGSIANERPPKVAPIAELGAAFAWSERSFGEPEQRTSLRGLGELRAQKPGEKEERKGAVTLTHHAVRTRIVGTMARTEVEEVFTNHTDEVLEGVFRFPLPADAQIERLALEVDGRLEEGAFVDRDRAAAIWRGAIVNSSKQVRPLHEEIVWVPGPWKDPALLEWQRGGRFELRIFPIPKRGERRIVLAYTQKLQPSGEWVRYQYPLAHDPSGSTRALDFSVDLQVRGHRGIVRSEGYEMERVTDAELPDSARFSFHRERFIPAGDVAVEFQLPESEQDLTVWAYRPEGAEASIGRGSSSAAATDRRPAATAPLAESSFIAAPDAPYVALALRPKFPARAANEKRAYVLVVDRSRSMFGEPYHRATDVVARLVEEMDRDDVFAVLDCDTQCDGFKERFVAPDSTQAQAVREYLGRKSPEGASDLIAALARAARFGERNSERQLKIIYVGDGTPTVGEVLPAMLRSGVARNLPPHAGVFAVTVGSDSDSAALQAIVEQGGGVVVPYRPGQSSVEVALSVLGASYGHALRDVELSLPEGFVDVAPRRLGTVAAGSEVLVVARLSRDSVSGPVRLTGLVAGKPFEAEYSANVVATSHSGNAFVPRLFAAGHIAELERNGSRSARERAVELSGRFNVASRYTSLLVLESPAMFRAFGLENQRTAPLWTGESASFATGASAENKARLADDDAWDEAPGDSAGDLGLSGLGSSSAGLGSSLDALKDSEAFAPPPSPRRSSRSAPRPRSKPKKLGPVSNCHCSPGDLMCAMRCQADGTSSPVEPRAEEEPSRFSDVPEPEWSRRRMIPMRKVWRRSGHIAVGSDGIVAAEKLAELEARLREDPLRRDVLKELYSTYLLNGRVDAAAELAERWSAKEPMDAEALTARADIAAEQGQRDLAIRILGSVLDVRPGDHRAEWRLARLHRWGNQPREACRYSLAAAQLQSSDAKLLAEAVHCLRAETGSQLMGVASELLGAADAGTRNEAERLLVDPAWVKEELSGDFRVEASWSGQEDLDLVILHPDGYRVSWLGAPTRAVISAQDVRSLTREGLALRGAKPGEYAVEVVRSSAVSQPVHGEIRLRVGNTSRSIPFQLTGSRTRVATVKVQMRSELVPL